MNDADKGETIFSVAEEILTQWLKISNVEVLNQEATINVLNSSVDYKISLKLPTNFWASKDEIIYRNPNIFRITASNLNPFPKTLYGVVRKVPDSTEHRLYPELLPSDIEYLSQEVTYKVENIGLIEDIVDTTSTHDPGDPNSNEYWMHAQIKDPDFLTKKFGRFDIRDVDVTVGVSVLEELNTSIPSPFISRIRAVFEILNEKDPRQQWRAIPRLRSTARESYAGKEFEILKEIEYLLLPSSFAQFIDIQKDFRYDTCFKGRESYELPIELIPKTMDVISRADLSLEKLAAEGTLIYKENLFQEALLELFGS